MRKSPEKRRANRKICRVPVEAKAGGAFSQTQTVDISKGGIGFVSHDSIPVAEHIVVELDFGPTCKSVILMAHVKWIRPGGKTDIYHFGLEFEKILSGSRIALSRITCN